MFHKVKIKTYGRILCALVRFPGKLLATSPDDVGDVLWHTSSPGAPLMALAYAVHSPSIGRATHQIEGIGDADIHECLSKIMH